MTERAARRAFAAVAVVLALALTVVLGAGEEPGPPSDEPAASTAQVVAAAEGRVRSARRTPEPADDQHGHDTPAGASDRREARQSARAFIAALLRFQAGAGRQTWLVVLEQSATRSLARRLVARPPRELQRSASLRGTVRSLEVHGPLHGRIRASAIISYGNGLRSLIDLELRRRAGRWRVMSLYR